MKLYEYAQALDDALEIDEETGEIMPGAEERFEALVMDREKKACDIACMVVELDAEEFALREQSKKLQTRAQITARRSAWLRMYLAQWLPEGTKIKDDRVSLRIGSSESVEIAEDAEIPAEFMVPKFSPDKKAIKTALEAGVTMPGAKIVTKRNVVIK